MDIVYNLNNDCEYTYYAGVDTHKHKIPEYPTGVDKSKSFEDVLKLAISLKYFIITKNGLNGKWYLKASKKNNNYNKLSKKLNRKFIEQNKNDTRNQCYLLKYGDDPCDLFIENEKELKNTEGFIYFVRYNDQDTIMKDHTKIGRSKTPKTRLSAFNTATSSIGGCYLYKVLKCEDYVNSELVLHRYIKDRRFICKGKQTEWFLLSIELIDEIYRSLTNDIKPT